MDETPNANRFTAAGLGIAAATFLAWVMEAFFEVAPPGPVVAAMSVLLGAVVQALYSLLPGFHKAQKRTKDVRTPWWVVLLLVPVFWLAGCALYEDVPIDDTRDAILVANAELRGANFLLQDVIRSGAISQADAQQAKDHLSDVHEGLAQALVAVDLHGDVVDAENRLDQALVALDLALALLAQYTAPPQAAVPSDFLEAA